MNAIFRIIEKDVSDWDDEKGICIGIDVKIAGREVTCPISETCKTYEGLISEGERIQDDLKRALEEGREFLEGSPPGDETELTADMSPEELWADLSKIQAEATFIERFNSLGEEKRIEVAEHVLTKCNIFSGMASLFAARYDSSSALLE